MLNLFYQFFSKILPVRVKQNFVDFFRSKLCLDETKVKELSFAGKPGTPNPWWYHLEECSNEKIFTEPSRQAKSACKKIRDAYLPVLEKSGINSDGFFLGSIKNDEAEVLYQMVLDQRPALSYQVGTFVGYSAMVIAHALQANGSGRLIAADPEIPHRSFCNPVDVAREVAEQLELDNIIDFVHGWHSGPSGDNVGLGLKKQIPTIGIQTLENISKEGIDFAFIDGDHSTCATLADLLILKEYLNMNGIILFHDVWSWPTVSQAITLFWHDIYYWVRGTPSYYVLDVRRGVDGLAVIKRIAYETFPNMQVKVVDEIGTPLSHAVVCIPAHSKQAKTGKDGKIYFRFNVKKGEHVTVSCDGYRSIDIFTREGTNGDFTELLVQLEKIPI